MLTPHVSEIVRTGAHSFRYENISANVRPDVRVVTKVCTDCGMRTQAHTSCPRCA